MPYEDLRSFIRRLDQEDQLLRVKREVDWNLELSHVAKVNEERQGGGRAMLFENVKDYPGDRVFTSALTAKERLALAMEMPVDTSLMRLSQEWVDRIQDNLVPPVEVDASEAPTRENVLVGDEAKLSMIPAPWFYPLDGGRYYGTAGFAVTRSLDTGRLNLGTYRAMIKDDGRLCVYMIKGKDGEIDHRAYEEAGIPMPVAYVSGTDPTLFMCSSTLFGLDESEYDVVGALRGEPVKVVKAETSDLLVPATAEWVVEGVMMPGREPARVPSVSTQVTTRARVTNRPTSCT